LSCFCSTNSFIAGAALRALTIVNNARLFGPGPQAARGADEFFATPKFSASQSEKLRESILKLAAT
jgi:hypothetical protein